MKAQVGLGDELIAGRQDELILFFLPLTGSFLPVTVNHVTSEKIYCIITPVLKDECKRG